MALDFDFSPLARALESFGGAATPGQMLLQAGIVLVALGLGWLVARGISLRVPVNPRWKFGEGDFARVMFPLAALAMVWVAKLALAGYQRVAILEIAQSLLLAFLAIRLAVYVLGHALPPGAFLRGVVRFVAWIAWLAVALHVIGLLPGAIEALDEIGVAVGKDRQRITLLLVLQAVTALALTLTVAAWLSRITESRVLAADTLEMSTRMVITKLVRVATLFLAVLVALPLVGIDITALSIFSGAFGVGLGFGLQKIASNYVSGFIVLLDRSLRIGDVITVDNRRGEVRAIETRYTVIRGQDGNEAIIPNELLITQSVTHHTYSDPRVTVNFDVSVSYDSDVEKACALLVEIAHHHPRLVDEPPPAALVKQLSESGVDLQLTAWIKDPSVGEGALRSEVLKEVLRTFRAHGIEIPYPRRDVHLIATAETAGKAL